MTEEKAIISMKGKPGFRASDRIEAGRIFECSTMLDCQRGDLSGQQLKKDP